MFVNPLFNQISAILSVPRFVGILGVGLIVGNEFFSAAREDDIYSITVRVVYELQSCCKTKRKIISGVEWYTYPTLIYSCPHSFGKDSIK